MKYVFLLGIAALAIAAVALASAHAQAQRPKETNQKGPDQKKKVCTGGPVNLKKVKVTNSNHGKNGHPKTNDPKTGKPPINTGKLPNNGLEPGETKKTQNNPFHHEAQKKSNQTLIHAFHVLQSTKLLLQKGDHDYGGHRVNAIKSIGVAQGELRIALGKYGKNMPPAPPGKGGPGKEAQKKSDAQLHHAIKTLQSTITHLANANYDYYGHRYKAVAALEGTLKQLQLALKSAK